ncbi:MAG TPA: hypothetical protein PK760_08275, partial [Flavobacteriales bacterium]|nr:hypothetical protein [Flavobacteriales bacterium]
MKRFVPFLASIIPGVAVAQPVLDQNVFPVTRSVFAYHDVNYQPASKPGIAVKWDYSMVPTGTIVPYAWVTTDIAPGAGAFP